MSKDKKELTDDELVELASKTIVKEERFIPEKTNDVTKFIRDYGIVEGPHKVEVGHIYNTYYKWGGKRSLLSFGRIFSQYFKKRYSDGKKNYYYLDKFTLPPMTPTIREEIRNHNKLLKMKQTLLPEASEKARIALENGDWKFNYENPKELRLLRKRIKDEKKKKENKPK